MTRGGSAATGAPLLDGEESGGARANGPPMNLAPHGVAPTT